jgi:hypothetical protein
MKVLNGKGIKHFWIIDQIQNNAYNSRHFYCPGEIIAIQRQAEVLIRRLIDFNVSHLF